MKVSASVIRESLPCDRTTWQRSDIAWMFTLYGTAIGAGVLFLPITAGMGGIWPAIIMALLALPTTFFAHRAVCRFMLSSEIGYDTVPAVVEEHFGAAAGRRINLLCFIAFCPVPLLLSVGIINTLASFIENQLGFAAPNRALLSFSVVTILILMMHLGQTIWLRIMSALVFPFIGSLLLIACSLIPHWNSAIFYADRTVDSSAMSNPFITLWLIIATMIFSFNHGPIIPSFALANRKKYGINAEKKCGKILFYGHFIMVTSIVFFVFSCIFTLTPAQLLEAKQQNISALSYIANHLHNPFISYLAPIIAIIGITSTFLGHYAIVQNGLEAIIMRQIKPSASTNNAPLPAVKYGVMLFILISTAVMAIYNPSILTMIESICGPIIALLLCLLPIYALYRIPALKIYRQRISDSFMVIMGLLAISATIYQIFV